VADEPYCGFVDRRLAGLIEEAVEKEPQIGDPALDHLRDPVRASLGYLVWLRT
jgi:hypothetical protein